MTTIRQPITIQASALDHFASVLAERGGNGPAILRAVGVDPRVLDEPEALIPLEAFRSALALAVQRTRDDAFGVRLGSAQSFERLGMLGYMLRSAPTVRQMVDDAAAYLRLHNPGIRMTVDTDGGLAVVSLIARHVGRAPLAPHLGLGQALLTSCLRTAIGSDWSPETVYFQESTPVQVAVYQQTFRCPVHFDQVITATEFPAADLDRPAPDRDDRLYRLFRKYLDEMDSLQRDDIIALVRVSVEDMLGHRRPTLETVAAALEMSPGVLQRRLKQAGVTFQDELGQLRISVAKRYLAETDDALSDIADMLGFAEPAVFSRAFRRATGISPSEWRKARRQRMRH